MLQTLSLRGYRGFESYQLTDFTRLNLLVGKNNSGKTSILEAVELLVADGHVSVFYAAAQRRGETAAYYRRGYGPSISNLFYGHHCEPGSLFELSSENDTRKLKVTIYSLEEMSDPDLFRRPSYVDDSSDPAFAMRIVSSEQAKETLFPISEDSSILDYRPVSRSNDSLERPVRFLSLESFASAAMGRAWNEILTTGREAEIVKDMELLLPDIDSIHFLTSDRPTGTGILVGRRGTGRRMPIGSYGDGMRRLLAFRLALVGAVNGFLLIDEIDAGLHWTVMEDVWRLLVEVAHRSNVQVFATTHSKDCIDGLAMLIRAHPDLADQVSIHNVDSSLPQAVSIPGAQIPVAVDQDIEVR